MNTTIKLQGGTRKYKEVQGNTRKYKEVQGSTRKYKEVQGSTRKYKEVLLFLTVLLTSISLFAQNTEPEDCSDIFISEVIFDNPLFTPEFAPQMQSALTPVDYNNVIELYNPTENAIDLATYSIVLTPEGSANPIIQYLYGTIESHETVLISNFNSNSDITNVSEVISSLIDFQGKVQIELKNGTVVKDRIGQTGATNAVEIDLDELLNNPVYLNGQEIDLTSIANFGIRRNPNVKKGNLTFDPAVLAQEWSVFPNTSLDNLGEYNCICAGGVIYFGLNPGVPVPFNQQEIEEGHPIFKVGSIKIKYESTTPVSGYFFNYYLEATGNASYGTDYEFTNISSLGSSSSGINISAPQSSKITTLEFEALDDFANEGVELGTLELKLSNNQHSNGGPTIIGPSKFTIRITDNDQGIGITEISKELLYLESTIINNEIRFINNSDLEIKYIYITNIQGATVKNIKQVNNSMYVGDIESGYYIINFVSKNTINTIKFIKS